MCSETRMRFQELELLRRRVAPEYAIAVREPTEPIDDVAMLARVVERHRIAERGEQLDGALLYGAIFAVLERQVEKRALLALELRIEAGANRLLRNRERRRIAREGASGIAKQVARE